MADAAVDWDRLVLIGVVARPHGIRGEMVVNLATDFAEDRFRVGAPLFVQRVNGGPEALDLTGVRFHQGRPLLQLRDVDSIEQAAKYARAEIRMAPEEQGSLPEGTYFHNELIECEVVTAAGERIGTVTKVQGEGEASRLVVTSGRGEVLIPLADEICRVDIVGRRITVTPPPGLLELNGEWR